MPDITMCANEDCSLAKSCYRSPLSGTKPSEGRQPWDVFEPSTDADLTAHCTHYIDAFMRRANSPADDKPQLRT